jgi:hypothetical protein
MNGDSYSSRGMASSSRDDRRGDRGGDRTDGVLVPQDIEARVRPAAKVK